MTIPQTLRAHPLSTAAMLLLLAGLAALSSLPIHSVAARSCSTAFTVSLSPTSATIQRGSHFLFTITPSGPQCLTGTMVEVRASITLAASGLTWRTNTYHMPLYDTPWIIGNTTLSTPAGTYTVTGTLLGTQSPLVGASQSGTASLIVT